jgi:tetratricopeptide (TPR) repeat protein
MKIKRFLSTALLLCSVIVILHSSITAQQDKIKPKVSDAESKAAKAVEAPADASAKLAAAEDFVKKYPKSPLREDVAEYVADQLLGVADSNQKLTLAQKFPSVFTEPAEGNLAKLALLDAYVQLKRLDEAFTTGGAYLATNGDDIQVLTLLAIAGTEAAKARNPKYVKESGQYGAKAIELLEADKKPEKMDAGFWTGQKSRLPQIYQEMAIISLMQGNRTEAQAKLEKSQKLSPTDPFNYVMMGSLNNDDYQKVAQDYQKMPDGKARDTMLQQANALLDKVIDQYAHAVALSEGKAQYQALHDGVLEDLTAYYKYRHNKSTDGLQKMIDGFKLP